MGRSMQEKIDNYTELAHYHMKLAHIIVADTFGL